MICMTYVHASDLGKGEAVINFLFTTPLILSTQEQAISSYHYKITTYLVINTHLRCIDPIIAFQQRTVLSDMGGLLITISKSLLAKKEA